MRGFAIKFTVSRIETYDRLQLHNLQTDKQYIEPKLLTQMENLLDFVFVIYLRF